MSVAAVDRCVEAGERVCCWCSTSIEDRPETARYCSRECQLRGLNARRGRSQTSGYSWRCCDVCGESMLLSRNRPCALTPGCGGYHRLGVCEERAA